MEKQLRALCLVMVAVLIGACAVDPNVGTGGGAGGGGTGGGAAPTPDTTPPTLVVSGPTNGHEVGVVYILQGTVSDNASGVQRVMVSVNEGAYVQANLVGNIWNYAVTMTSGTSRTNDIYALDVAGNSSATNRIIVSYVPRQVSWTIMVYMGSDSDLEAAAMEDLNEIEAGLAGVDGKAHVVVLVDRSPAHDTSDGNWTGTRLYYMLHESGGMNRTVISSRLAGMGLTNIGDSDERNTGDPAVLQAFVDYVNTHFPATNTMLVLWGHGDGWRNRTVRSINPSLLLRREVQLSSWSMRNQRDRFQSMFPSTEHRPSVAMPHQSGLPDVIKGIAPDGTSGYDQLQNSEVRTAITGRGISMLGADSCLMGMLEVAYEWRSLARYLIASADLVPGDGWEYDQWLPRFLSSDLSKSNLYRSIVDTYAIRYATYQTTTMAVYDLSRMDGLFSAFEVYVTNLYNDLLNPAHELRSSNHFFTVFNNVDGYTFPTPNGFHHVDVFELADKMDRGGGAAVKTALTNAVVYEWHHPGGDLWTGNPNSTGMALYYWTWLASGQYVFPFVRPDYVLSNFTLFHQSSLWDLYIDAVINQWNVPWLSNGVDMSGTLITNRDFKFHQFYVAQPGTVTATLSWTGGMDFDLYLGDVRTGALLGASAGTANPESLTITIPHPGWYIVEAFSRTGIGSYTIRVTGGTAVLR